MKTETRLQPEARISQRSDVIVYSQLVLTMTIWGAAWPVGRLLAENLPTISIAVIRYLIVVPILFLILQYKEHNVRIRRDQVGILALLGLLSTTLYQAFFLYGVKYAAASDDSIVIGMGPVIIAVLASLFAQEPLGRKKILGLVLGASGVTVIALLSPNTDVPNRFLGISLVFCGTLSYSTYTVLLRRFLSKTKAQEETRISSLAILTWISLSGMLIMVPFSIMEQPWTSRAWTVPSWIGILYLAILSTVIGYFFFVEGVSRIGASRAAVFNNIVPVSGVVSSYFLLGESLSIWHLLSFLLIFSGVYVVNSNRLGKKRPPS